ncbi:MAG: hypothetical protein K0S78_5544 [Thermomicrobiales bacterium]|nr:hypothetical protein [Thermomicrobiales bacterium]
MNQLRILWSVAALLVAGAFLLVLTGAPTALGQDSTPGTASVAAPDWTFVVHGVQDPYAGALTTPPEPAEGMRYVGFDVEVVNESDQPLSFAGTGVYLRDEEGFSYRSGTVGGREPALSGRTMSAGERARGWVWFEVPEGATLTEILLVPVAPELRVGLAEVANIPGTPGSTAADTTPSPAATAAQVVTPLATEPPEAAATATTAPAAPQAPTSVITIEEPAETTEETVAATATPGATATPAATSTPVPIVTPAIVTSAPTSTPPAAETDIEPGISAVNAESDANLRAGPSLDAEIIGTIPVGSELSVTGPAEAEGDALWWPVIVVATGEEGYVADELLTPLDEE